MLAFHSIECTIRHRNEDDDVCNICLVHYFHEKKTKSSSITLLLE